MHTTRYNIEALHAGQPKEVEVNGSRYLTSINKARIEDRRYLSTHNVEGDAQADLKNHGGKDKALCIYPVEHYSYWETVLGHSLAHGAFGENVTINGRVEADVYIGDTYQFGEAVIQVSQPRQPCYKLANKWHKESLVTMVHDTGYSGYYVRVLQEGYISTEDHWKLIDQGEERCTVRMANEAMFTSSDTQFIAKVAQTEGLAENWQRRLLKKLKRLSPS
ncbi:MOSC domain-containing protein [Caldalkalibacillus salinus]|uniref:MOSC domain-containing protein n=1 Tax=Caldalkalibacillus salinus TaxID=2803787 RepID=UPI0019248AD2|nr:MOSC domain-containing protein [Caldalkalibacillus salinus]